MTFCPRAEKLHILENFLLIEVVTATVPNAWMTPLNVLRKQAEGLEVSKERDEGFREINPKVIFLPILYSFFFSLPVSPFGKEDGLLIKIRAR
ncbi:hypothetical protein NPIL_497501 [Nephila pilipes]|uniref:Uncharacterized protein n=1 Tax=Nephila pilipes TaxID=299642 RepID=A0A8X6UTF4_NEPPI|nr:hypothetical protein NPIL_497501 [Nephila pilipes]